jgi:hypothetical protein
MAALMRKITGVYWHWSEQKAVLDIHAALAEGRKNLNHFSNAKGNQRHAKYLL